MGHTVFVVRQRNAYQGSHVIELLRNIKQSFGTFIDPWRRKTERLGFSYNVDRV